jgi:hypothetical protein
MLNDEKLTPQINRLLLLAVITLSSTATSRLIGSESNKNKAIFSDKEAFR